MNPFEQFGGKALEQEEAPKRSTAPSVATPDPFAQFGGKSLQATPAAAAPAEPAKTRRTELAEARNEISQDEIQAIADKYNVDANKIKPIVNLTGMLTDTDDNVGTYLGGLASETFGAGLGKFAVKKLGNYTEAEKQAMDELVELAQDRKSWTQTGLELGAGLVSSVGVGKAVAKGALKLYGTGERALKAAQRAERVGVVGGMAAVGLGDSAEGEELQSAALMGAIGGATIGLGASVRALGRWRAARKLPKDEQINFVKAVKAAGSAKNLDEMADDLYNKNLKEEEILKQDALAMVQASKESLAQARKLQANPETAMEALGTTLTDTTATEIRQVRALQTMQDFARYVAGTEGLPDVSTARGIIRDRLKSQGDEFLSREFEAFRKAQHLQKHLAQSAEEVAPELHNSLSALGYKLADGRVLSRIIDEKSGTKLERILDEGSERHARFTNAMGAVVPEIKRLVRSVQHIPDLIERVETNRLDDLAAADKDAVLELKSHLAKARLEANKMGVPIRQLSDKAGIDYFPRTSLNPVEYTLALSRRAAELGLDPREGKLLTERFSELKDAPAFKDLVTGIELKTGEAVSESNFQRLLNQALDVGSPSAIEDVTSGAAMRRIGLLPDFLREKDVGKALIGWHHGVYRQAYYRDTLQELQGQEELLRAGKNIKAADWVRTLRQDLAGIRPGTFTDWTTKQAARYSIAARMREASATNPLSKAFYGMLAKAPEIGPLLLGQMYPNYLGLRPASLITNLTQPFALSVPELGYRATTAKAMASYADLLRMPMEGRVITVTPDIARLVGKPVGSKFRTSSPGLWLKAEGLLPEQWNQELVGAMQNGIQEASPWELTKEALDQMSKAAMYLYEKTEVVNRFVAVGIADRLATGIMRGTDEGALRALSRMGPSYQRAIQKAVAQKDDQAVKKLLRQYVIGRTIFNYNRITMNEFGRTAGSLFSTFTKWPASIGTDIARNTGRGTEGVAELTRKYLAPFAALSLAEKLLFPEYDENTQLKAWFGSAGPSAWAPIGAVERVATGEAFVPPGLQSVTQLGGALFQTDPQKANEAVDTAIRGLMPGWVYLRVLMEDLPRYQGEQPDKRTAQDIMLEPLNIDWDELVKGE